MNKFLEEDNWNYYILIVPILLFMSIFLVWAALSEVDEVVRGEGKVIPSGQTKILQHLEGGIISDILVQEGYNVEKNQILYILNNEFFNSEFKSKEIELLAYKAKALRLKALVDDDKTLKYSNKFHENIPGIIRSELEIFNGEQEYKRRQVSIAENKLNQKKLKLLETQSKIDNLLMEFELASQNMKIQEDLLKKKIVSKKKYIEEFAKKQKIYTQLQDAKNQLPIIKQEIQEAQRVVINTKYDIDAKNLKKYSEINIEIKKLEETSKASADRKLRSEVLSPVKGIINKLYYHTVGGIVKAGDTMAEITPLEDSLMIEAKIKVSDRALIWVGQKVSIEITAYDFSKYGLLEGSLVQIAPDSTLDKTGMAHYIVKVQAKNYSFDAQSPILLGMIANVNILSGKKTILKYLIKPLKDIAKNSMNEQ